MQNLIRVSVVIAIITVAFHRQAINGAHIRSVASARGRKLARLSPTSTRGTHRYINPHTFRCNALIRMAASHRTANVGASHWGAASSEVRNAASPQQEEGKLTIPSSGSMGTYSTAAAIPTEAAAAGYDTGAIDNPSLL